MEWIWFGNATCPLTRKPLHPSNFSLDVSLQREILEWKSQSSDWEGTSENAEEDEEEAKYLMEELRKKDELIRQRAEALRERLQKRRAQESTEQPMPEVPSYLQCYV